MLIVEEVVGVMPIDQGIIIEDDEKGEVWGYQDAEYVWEMDSSLLSREVKTIEARDSIITITI